MRVSCTRSKIFSFLLSPFLSLLASPLLISISRNFLPLFPPCLLPRLALSLSLSLSHPPWQQQQLQQAPIHLISLHAKQASRRSRGAVSE
uniref:Uncharacterized protein n=1 Tax=Arundo donax TaxID=35708 RepID=A0A0A9E3P0_ARUDO